MILTVQKDADPITLFAFQPFQSDFTLKCCMAGHTALFHDSIVLQNSLHVEIEGCKPNRIGVRMNLVVEFPKCRHPIT